MTETKLFSAMYLADYRAVEYLASRPDWDGKTLVVMGTSMGGQQSLAVAVSSKITHSSLTNPAGCDSNGNLHGGQAGIRTGLQTIQRLWNRALFRHSQFCFSHQGDIVGLVLIDTTAPPVGFDTLNQFRSKEAALM